MKIKVFVDKTPSELVNSNILDVPDFSFRVHAVQKKNKNSSQTA